MGIEATHQSAIGKRWLSLMAVSFLGVSFWIAMFPLVERWLVYVLTQPWWRLIAVLPLLTVPAFHGSMGRWGAVLGLRHPLSFPPIWLAGTSGAGASLMLLAGSSSPLMGDPDRAQLLDQVGGWMILAPFLALLIIAFFQVTTVPELPSEDANETEFDIPTTFEGLVEWIQDDTPVSSAAQDYFGRASVARRMARRILEPHSPSQAVIGELGSGKSSLRFLLKEQLDKPAGDSGALKTVIVPIELWQYQTTAAAVEGAIASLVAALGQEVEVLSVRGLPGEYLRAVTTVGGKWGELLGSIGHQIPTIESLQKLDELAKAIDFRFVVWVEDLERFAGNGNNESTADAEKLNPIRAFLHALDRLDRFTVITATTSLSASFDIEKIARHVEQVPGVLVSAAAEILATFRTGCLEQFPDDFDPTAPAVRKDLNVLSNPTALALSQTLGHPKSLADHLIEMAVNPRALKQALRAIYETWQVLHGEIDFDDLMIMTFLKVQRPEIFSIIHDHYYELSETEAGAKNPNNREQHFATAVSNLLNGRPGYVATMALVEFVFKKPGQSKLQGFSQQKYWQRFLNSGTAAAHEQDQTVIKMLLTGSDDHLLDLIEGPQWETAENFCHLIDRYRLSTLLEPLIVRRCNEDPSTWGYPENPYGPEIPGFIPLWRLWNGALPQAPTVGPLIGEAVLNAALYAATRNPFLAVQIEHYFGEAGQDDNSAHLTPEQFTEVATKWRVQCADHFAQDPNGLAAALRGVPPFTLYRVCWIAEADSGDTTTRAPFAGWENLVPAVLLAMVIEPRTMMPQVALLISREVMGGRKRTLELDIERAVAAFGTNDDLAGALRKIPSDQWPKGVIAEVLQNAMNSSE